MGFKTAAGFGVAVARLVAVPGAVFGLRAWTLLTKLQGLKGFEPLPPDTWPGCLVPASTETTGWRTARPAACSPIETPRC